MINKNLYLLFFVFLIYSVSAQPVLHTPEVITVSSGKSVIPISFFNDGPAREFNGAFVSNSEFGYLQEYSVNVDKESYGSISIVLGDSDIAPGIYFGHVLISDESGLLFNVPVVYARESPLPQKFDTSISFNEVSDTNFNSGELTISPNIDIYKLDFNPSTSNNLAFYFEVYDLQGNILDSSEKSLSVSSRTSFKQFSNLGNDYPEEVILFAKVTHNGLTWLDVASVKLPKSEIALSPIDEKRDYSSWLYTGIFIFLLASMIVLSYFWNHRAMKQAGDWRSRVNYIKKTQFTDTAKAMRNLKYQKDVLERAYASHYITKESYLDGLSTIEKLSEQLKKRL